MKQKLSIIALTAILISCSKEDDIVVTEPELSIYELNLISYFKDIALGFEIGNSAKITRKWNSSMKIFLDGNPNQANLDKVEQTINEINELATDGFFAEIVKDSSLSNCYVFFGSASEFSTKFPDAIDDIGDNYGLFNIWWTNNYINRARIFIDTYRASPTQQESLVLEEITQSLGLGRDSPKYPNSIFYETPNNGGFATQYAEIDKDLIRLLYHPDMKVGLNAFNVEELLRTILIND